MKSFVQKKAELAKIKDKLAKAKISVFTTFSRSGEKGLNVTELGELKKRLRGVEAEYVVGKKTLVDLALKNSQKQVGADQGVFGFAGSLGVTFGYGEETAAAKTLYNFTRKYPALKLLGALWGDQVLDEKSFLEFAKLPTREVLIGRILGLMNYPLSALANVLGQTANKRNA